MADKEVEYQYRIAGDEPQTGGPWAGAFYPSFEAAQADVLVLRADPTWSGDTWVERRPLGEWERIS